jgi:peptidoglycan/LPS O-acetylase OafA/YrhL
VGVDLFFVLSGFLIGGILLRDLERGASWRGLTSFWSRRWWRTLPNYYLFLAMNLAAFRVLGHSPDTLRYLVFLQGAWWGPGPVAFPESWSLCVEEWFYLLFALLAFGGARLLPGRRSYLLAAAMLAAGSFASRALLVLLTDSPFSAIRFSTPLHLDSLMFGVVAAYASSRWPSRWERAARPAAWAGLATLAAGLALRVVLTQEAALTRLVYPDAVALGTALLLPWLSARRDATGKAAGFVTKLSLYSYSMYLVNLPLARLLVRGVLVPDGPAAAALLTAAWLAGTYAISGLCYRFYESPMTRLRDVQWPGLPRLSPGSRARGRAARKARAAARSL